MSFLNNNGTKALLASGLCNAVEAVAKQPQDAEVLLNVLCDSQNTVWLDKFHYSEDHSFTVGDQFWYQTDITRQEYKHLQQHSTDNQETSHNSLRE